MKYVVIVTRTCQGAISLDASGPFKSKEEAHHYAKYRCEYSTEYVVLPLQKESVIVSLMKEHPLP